MTSIIKKYTKSEEIFNAVTHGIGILLSVIGISVLIPYAAIYGDAWKIVASSIYGFTLIVLYSASTLYHSFQNEKLKKIFNMFDHISIYFLIAGTYTPFLLVNMRGVWGWIVFGIVWTSAIAGTTLKLIYGNRFRKVSTILYLCMGWIIVIAIKPLILSTEPIGLILIVAGGLLFSFGVIFYKWKSLPFNHGIWHIFVLLGTVCHFFAVLFFVVLDNNV